MRCGSIDINDPVAIKTSCPFSNLLKTKTEAEPNVIGANIVATNVESVGINRSNLIHFKKLKKFIKKNYI